MQNVPAYFPLFPAKAIGQFFLAPHGISLRGRSETVDPRSSRSQAVTHSATGNSSKRLCKGLCRCMVSCFLPINLRCFALYLHKSPDFKEQLSCDPDSLMGLRNIFEFQLVQLFSFL